MIFETVSIGTQNRDDKFALLWGEAQGKGRPKGRPRKVTQIYRWWMVDGGYPFPDALH